MDSLTTNFKCFKCGQPSHRSSDCPKRKFIPQANLIDQEGADPDKEIGELNQEGQELEEETDIIDATIDKES